MTGNEKDTLWNVSGALFESFLFFAHTDIRVDRRRIRGWCNDLLESLVMGSCATAFKYGKQYFWCFPAISKNRGETYHEAFNCWHGWGHIDAYKRGWTRILLVLIRQITLQSAKS